MLKRLNVSSEAQSEDEWVEILKLWHLGSHNVLMLAFQNSGTMATQRASFQLSDACYSSPFPCFSGLQALTECLLPASSQLNDVTVHLVGDDSSAARVVFFWSLSHFRKGSSFTQGPSKPLSLCLFVSRAPFFPPDDLVSYPLWYSFELWLFHLSGRAVCDTQGWAVAATSRLQPSLSSFVTSLGRAPGTGKHPILPRTSLDIPC